MTRNAEQQRFQLTEIHPHAFGAEAAAEAAEVQDRVHPGRYDAASLLEALAG